MCTYIQLAMYIWTWKRIKAAYFCCVGLISKVIKLTWTCCHFVLHLLAFILRINLKQMCLVLDTNSIGSVPGVLLHKQLNALMQILGIQISFWRLYFNPTRSTVIILTITSRNDTNYCNSDNFAWKEACRKEIQLGENLRKMGIKAKLLHSNMILI